MRIRTIKPDFFIDEDLQDLEKANPGAYVMIVFAGLWGNCDKRGVFEWRARRLKLHILPYLDFDMEETLGLLLSGGLISRFEVGGKVYGYVPTFEKHQRITGKEAQEEAKYPDPPSKIPTDKPPGSGGETPGKQPGERGEAPETTGREGKGRESEGKGMPASEESQSERTDHAPKPEAGEQAGVSLTERSLRKCVEEKRGWLKENFPDADIGLELEELVAKYRRESIGSDPWLLVLRWFRKIPDDRASPKVGGSTLAEETRESNKQACRDFAGGGSDG